MPESLRNRTEDEKNNNIVEENIINNDNIDIDIIKNNSINDITDNIDDNDDSCVIDQLKNVSWQKQLYVKIGYGFGEGGCYIVSSITSFFISSFLLEVAQLPATLAGIVILVSECVDGISDPITGKLSDETKTRWGRRRPWLFFGIFPLCIFFFLLFCVPPLPNVTSQFIYYLFIYICVKLSYASVAVPYTALTPEITMDYDQRTSLTMWRMILGMIASLISTAGHAAIITLIPTDTLTQERRVYAASIFIWSFVAFVCVIITVITTREYFPKELLSNTRSLMKLLKESKDALITREFLSVAVLYSCSWIAINFLQSNLLLWGKYVLDEEDMFSIYILVIQTATIISLFGWKLLSYKIGKKMTTYFGLGIMIVTCAGFGLLHTHQTFLAMSFSILGGIGVGNLLLMPWSMLPDVMELDEIKCGYRREGVFYSWFVFFQKIGIGISLGVSSLWLGWAGYVPPDSQIDGETQPNSVILSLRIMMGVVPIILFIIGSVATKLFPITKKYHAEIIEQVIVKRKEKLEENTEEEEEEIELDNFTT